MHLADSIPVQSQTVSGSQIFSVWCLRVRSEKLVALLDHLLNFAGLVSLEILHQLHLLLLIQTSTPANTFLTPLWIKVIGHRITLVCCIALIVYW